jgi:hypothetical protein
MHKFVSRFAILASVVVFAAVTTGCAREGDSERSSSSPFGPSSVDAKGGGGKPSGGGTTGGSSSLSLVMVTDNNANGGPNWGDQITFNISQTATTEPHVDLKCTQGGTVVLGATAGFYASYPWPWTQIMTLSSPSWTSGAADCTATLYYFAGTKNVVLSTLRFTAAQ